MVIVWFPSLTLRLEFLRNNKFTYKDVSRDPIVAVSRDPLVDEYL